MNTKDVRALLDLFRFPLPKEGEFGPEYSHLDVQIAIREAAISHLMNMTLQCLGAIRALVLESEVVRVSHDCTDIDGSQRDSGNAQHLQRQVFAQAVQTMTSTIVVGRELDRQDPVKTLVESFPWKPNFLSNQWLMLQWQLMDLPPRDALLREEHDDHQTYLRLVKEVVKYYPQTLAEIDKFGQHYLYYVIQSQSLPLLRLFLRYHSKIIRLPDHHGKLPLHYVVTHSQHVDALHLLCEHMQQSIREVSQSLRDNYGNTLLHLAAAGDSSEAILQEILFAHPESVKVVNNDRQYPLHFAAATTQQVLKLQKLFTSYPEAITLPDKRGLFPLHQAALTNRHVDVAQYLYQCFPEAMKIPLVACGRIPLHYATVKCSSTKLLRWMLQQYPASARVMDGNQRLPLHNLIARSENVWSPLRVRCLRMLLAAYPEGAGFKDKGGYTPLALARRDGHGDLILRLLLRADPTQDPEALADISYIAAQAKYRDMRRYDTDRRQGRTTSTRRSRHTRRGRSRSRSRSRSGSDDYDDDRSGGGEEEDRSYTEDGDSRSRAAADVKYRARRRPPGQERDAKDAGGGGGGGSGADWLLDDDDDGDGDGGDDSYRSYSDDDSRSRRRRSRRSSGRQRSSRPPRGLHGSTIASQRSYRSGYVSQRSEGTADDQGSYEEHTQRTYSDEDDDDGDDRAAYYDSNDEADEPDDDAEEDAETASAYEYRSVLSSAAGSASYSERRDHRRHHDGRGRRSSRRPPLSRQASNRHDRPTPKPREAK